jgi:hypothetical protein
MQDALLVIAMLFAFLVAGYPACLLLPADTFRARFVVAPTVGFAVLSVGIIGLYKLGISPRWSLYAMCTIGLVATLAHVLGSRQRRLSAAAPTNIHIAAATAAVVVATLLPAWIGGAPFTVFQGNVYDQFIVYLPGSVVFHQYDYATVMSAAIGAADNPVVARAGLALKRPISIVHAAFIGTHATAVASSYAFTVALQVNIFFSALFLALQVFESRARTAILASSALTVGFFQQYVLDINAWAQLSTQPIYLLVVTIVVLAFDPLRFGARPGEAMARLGLFFVVLMAAATTLYPDSCAVYGVAAGGAALVGLIAPKPWTTRVVAFTATGLATAAAFCFSYWSGALPSIVAAATTQALKHLDWWRYFQGYLLGRSTNTIDVLASDPSWSALLRALLALPVDSAVAGVGLYWLLPGPSVPEIVAVTWRVILCVFMFLLFSTAIQTTIATLREKPAGNQAGFLAACVAGCLVPIVFLPAGLYWTAGKSFSIAAPLLFFFMAAPLLSKIPIPPLARTATTVFLAGHLLTGALRPVFALDPIGKMLPGLPGRAPAIEIQKAGMDWRMDRLAEHLRGCHGVNLNIRHPFMQLAARMVATDLGVSWVSLHAIDLTYTVWPAYQPAGWELADCIASDDLSDLHAGRRVIWVVSDRQTFEFLDAPSGALEIGLSGHPGIAVDGAYAVETVPGGRLRWTSGEATFRVANSPSAPALKLMLSFWPMPLSTAAQLRLTINDQVAFEGPVPSDSLTVPLHRFAADPSLTIALKTTPITHYPNDSRDLGLALRQVRLEKSP